MTRDDVAKACGLESPIEYIERTGKGRTTAMICDAVVAATLGKRVFILAQTQRYASQLAYEARMMAKRCGVDDTLFESRSFEQWEQRHEWRGVREPVVLRDHYRGP